MQTFSESFILAADLIHYSNRSVFLTGKAGTGKTTFLKHIREHTGKQTAVVAPTGVAAINAGGTTIHSFFQLPFTPFVPESKGFSGNHENVTDKHHLLGRIRMTNERRGILQQLELLIIDEISMVRSDTIDAIDTLLRHFRNRHSEPFGGVQLLLIGDMYQLPPVIPDEEWRMLSQFYSSPYFFSSRVMEQYQPIYVELDKIYRQSDATFISILNQVRNNELDAEGLAILHRHYDPSFQASKQKGYITLTTHNHKAQTINTEELGKLKEETFSFKATVEREFSEKSYPAEETLYLKIGAQVMFIKNDVEKIRRYFNGKIGIIQKIDDGKIWVQCGTEELIEVKKETWKNIRYTLNKETQRVEEEEMGSFTQYPLRLAWAITIHKSQGLTFEKAVIDAGAAFAPGQVYVALSRCTSLEGIVLLSRINTSSLATDERIVAFSQTKVLPAAFNQELSNARTLYQKDILLHLFDLASAVPLAASLVRIVADHATAFNEEALPWIQNVQATIDALQQTGKKFQVQLQQLFSADGVNDAIQDRIKAAANYFDGHFTNLLRSLASSPAVTDSRQYSMAYNEDMQCLHIALAQQAHFMRAFKNGFSVEIYHQCKNNFVVPPFSVNAYATASGANRTLQSPHPELYKQLKVLRDELCARRDLPVYMVASGATLNEMVTYLPQTPKELESISGMGTTKIEKYGAAFLEIITRYSEQHGLSSSIHEKEGSSTPAKAPKAPPKEKAVKEPKPDTKLESFKLFKEGKSVTEIAATRNLTVQTIEGHLAHFVETGEIPIHELVSREKLVIIEPALKDFDGTSIMPIKQKLGDSVSFGEIRLAIAWKDFENRKQ